MPKVGHNLCIWGINLTLHLVTFCYLHIGFILSTFGAGTSTTFYSRLEPLINCHSSLKFGVIPRWTIPYSIKTFFKDWLSLYLLDCGWYPNYLKDSIATFKVTFHEKIQPNFQFILHASITIKTSKKKGKRKGKK